MLIRLKALRVRTTVGVHPWEQQAPREVVMNVELAYDGAAAAASDRLEDAPDYAALAHRILAAVEPRRYRLLEALAEHVASVCLDEPRLTRVTVEIDKPAAVRFCESVAVVHTKTRP